MNFKFLSVYYLIKNGNQNIVIFFTDDVYFPTSAENSRMGEVRRESYENHYTRRSHQCGTIGAFDERDDC